MRIELTKKIAWAFKKKRELGVKTLILIGGRGSTKSTGAADYVLANVSHGQRWCCAREYQNSIDDSCHALLREEIDRLQMPGFDIQGSCINHTSGGQAFYKGLSRNPLSIKSIVADGIWIEEGEALTKKTLDALSASFRVSAAKKERARRAGVQAKIPDIIITMNRGNSKDPISLAYLKESDADVKRKGWYADEDVLVVEVNYTDMPRQWFLESGLEQERLRDERVLTQAEYDHKWHAAYNDSIDNAIILPEWFDACVDAHLVLGFKPLGQKKVSYDPSDGGSDNQGLVCRHGVVIVDAQEGEHTSIDDATDWATDYANEVQADAFTWDVGGMGLGLKRQVSDAFKGKKVTFHQFDGAAEAFDPDQPYMPVYGEKTKPKTNKEAFRNKRAQCYMLLRDRIFRTWQAVNKKAHYHPDDLISISSEISCLSLLRSEVCRVPEKKGTPRIQILNKEEMKKLDIDSPNIADSLMMLEDPVDIKEHKPIKLKMKGWGQ